MSYELRHWVKVAEKDIKEIRNRTSDEDYIYELSYFVADRLEYCSDRWCLERLIHVEILMNELKKKFLKIWRKNNE